MRIIFIHGINQQGKDRGALLEEWKGHIETGLGQPGALDDIPIEMPFYGDRLHMLTEGDEAGFAVAQGPDGMDDREARFVEDLLDEMAAASGIEQDEIDQAEEQLAGSDAVGQGLPMHRRINAVLRLLQRISPLKGHVALTFVRQANAYLKKPAVGSRIDAEVFPTFRSGPAVVVAHSLGTVISFKLLRQLMLEGTPMDVPLFVTLGSPLTLRSVRGALGPQFLIPASVGNWYNAFDPDDSVSLGAPLNAANFAEGIVNYGDIENIPGDAHSIEGYLSDPRIAKLIYAAAS